MIRKETITENTNGDLINQLKRRIKVYPLLMVVMTFILFSGCRDKFNIYGKWKVSDVIRYKENGEVSYSIKNDLLKGMTVSGFDLYYHYDPQGKLIYEISGREVSNGYYILIPDQKSISMTLREKTTIYDIIWKNEDTFELVNSGRSKRIMKRVK